MCCSNQEEQCRRCVPLETCIRCVQLAVAYVPFQQYCGVWSPCRSLATGTAFPELYSPYRRIEYVNLEPEVTCSPPIRCGVAQDGRTCRG